MAKKATKKLLRKFKNAGDGKQIRGVKTGANKTRRGKEAREKKEVVSLAKVLQKKLQPDKNQKRKRVEDEPNQEKRLKKVAGELYNPETGSAQPKEFLKADYKKMSLEDLLTNGFKDEEILVTELDEPNQLPDEDISDDEEEDHQDELKKLKETDPEFYAHLKANASDLLEFSEASPKQKNTQEGVKLKKGQKFLKMERFNEIWLKAKEKPSTAIISSLINIFHSATLLSSPSKLDEDATEKKRNKGKPRIKYVIVDPKLLHKATVQLIKNFPEVLFPTLCQGKKFDLVSLGQLEKVNFSINSFKKLKSHLKVLINSFLMLLENAKDFSMSLFLLKSFSSFVPVAAQLFHMGDVFCIRQLLKHFIELWTTSNDPSVSVAAFLRIKQLVLQIFLQSDKNEVNSEKSNKLSPPSGFLEFCIKKCYSCFVREAKHANSQQSVSKLGFMAKCIVELFGINFRVSYQLGFIYIRQLSLQLRTALIEPSQEHLGQVYSHQFIHCLKLWGLVLSSYCSNFQDFIKDSNSSDKVILSELSNVSFAQLNYGEIEQILNLEQKNQKKNLFREELRPLIYPLVQIIEGTIDLAPTPQYFAVRLHLVNILNSLAGSSKQFIAVFRHLSIVLSSPLFSRSSNSFNKKKKGATSKPKDIEIAIRLSREQLDNHLVKNLLFEKMIKLLTNHVELMKFSVGFPELSVPIIHNLKKFVKQSQAVQTHSSLTKKLCKKVEKYSSELLERRKKSKFGPGSVSRIFAFSDDLEREAADKEAEKNQSHMPLFDSDFDKDQDETEQVEVEAMDEEQEISEEEASPVPRKKQGDLVESLVLEDSDEE